LPLKIDVDLVGHNYQSSIYYIISTLLTAIGVFLYNSFEEKKQKANVEAAFI
jgi:hypothetical protein